MRNINHCETIFQQFRVLQACLKYIVDTCPHVQRPCFKKCVRELRRSTHLTAQFLLLPKWKKWLINIILEM